ncbi:MAG: hypothetical protein JWO35_410 [Candidatus Saccharibacteria bacterium]|nr:hypothetical protein [Candidatus Saccharibacteria bacterium]
MPFHRSMSAETPYTNTNATFEVERQGVDRFVEHTRECWMPHQVSISVLDTWADHIDPDNPLGVLVGDIPQPTTATNNQLIDFVHESDGSRIPIIKTKAIGEIALRLFGEEKGTYFGRVFPSSISSYLMDSYVSEYDGFFVGPIYEFDDNDKVLPGLLRADTFPLLVRLLHEAREIRPIRKGYPLSGYMPLEGGKLAEELLEDSYRLFTACLSELKKE